MYSLNEYDAMWNLFVIPSWISFFTSFILLIDSIYAYAVHTPENIKARKGNILKFQMGGAIFSILFFIFGPLLMTIYKYELSCKHEVFDYFENEWDDENRQNETKLCKTNKLLVYFLLLVFNVVTMHIASVYQQLKDSAAMKRNAKTPIWLKLFCGFLIFSPFIFSTIALLIDGTDTDVQSVNRARWSIFCGLRLYPMEEIFLVHIPFLFSGMMIMIFVTKTRLIMNKMTSVGKTGEKKSKSSVALQKLGRKLGVLGLLVSILVIALIIVTVAILPNLADASKAYADWSNCAVFSDADLELRTANNCSHLMTMLGVTTNEELKLLGANAVKDKPSAFLNGLLYALQSSIPFIFSIFYMSLALKKWKTRSKVLTSYYKSNFKSKVSSSVESDAVSSSAFSSGASSANSSKASTAVSSTN